MHVRFFYRSLPLMTMHSANTHASSCSAQFPVCCSALRELALTFYDTRAIVVELVARLVGMGTLLGTPLYARQLAALEALQIYAPLGHGLGLRALCAQLEDRCFQVRHLACLCTAPAGSQWASESVACILLFQATCSPPRQFLHQDCCKPKPSQQLNLSASGDVSRNKLSCQRVSQLLLISPATVL